MNSVMDDKEYLRRALEISVHVGLAILLFTACLYILRPFIPLIAWGVVIAISVYPGYARVKRAFGGRGGLAALACTLLMLSVLIAPVILLTGTVVEGAEMLVGHIRNGTLTIPPPPAGIESWPIIGPPVKNLWSGVADDLTAALVTYAPQIKAMIPALLSASAGVGFAVLEFMLAVLVAGFLLANSQAGARASRSLADRLLGERGQEFEELVGSTIRSVTTGILGVALIQSAFAGIGFLVAGLPGAGLWAVIFLVAAVLQVGPLVMIPAVVYMFATASTSKAVLFLIWCLIVGTMDNVLKPLLLGRGVAVPMAVIFMGAIGGFLAMGIIGLFVGAIALSVGYKLFLAWLERGGAQPQKT